MHWTGYMVHFTESCEADEPHLVLHADTTPADVHEARRTQVIHTALACQTTSGTHPGATRGTHPPLLF